MSPVNNPEAPVNSASQPDTGIGPESSAPPQVSVIEGWSLHEYPVVGSTNLVAAKLEAWNAVRAERQTAGRGRFQRSWVSDEGGLWLSAVVPTDPKSPSGRALPIAVGLAVCDALRKLGVPSLRMRWPNDLLVNDRKLAGLLIDQFTPGLAVAGIGINVFNRPEAHHPLLRNQTVRLADVVSRPPPLRDLAALVLAELRGTIGKIEAGSFAALLPRVNQLWGRPRRVELEMEDGKCAGIFNGVDAGGRLILSNDLADSIEYEPWQVRHLTELTTL
jgi:BirA family biotin operon repressor/biotin-[acetyl-CoA-carboxylase] ligase